MSTAFRHYIKEYNWQTGNGYKDFTLVSEKTFRNSFVKSAYKWFDFVVKSKYPEAKKIKDTTIAGYHYEFNNQVIELH